MLVLSRKQDQTILIGDNITIQVLQIKGNTVRLGISAPREIKISRGELAPFGIESDAEVEIDVEVVLAQMNGEGPAEACLTNEIEVVAHNSCAIPFLGAPAPV